MPIVTTEVLRNASVASAAIAKLKQLIEEGGLEEGARLPSERELAKQLAVGRPTIREAIRALGMLEILESRRGAGTYVKSLARIRSDWPNELSQPGPNFSMLELLELRRMIEPRAAALAAIRGSEAQLREIERERVLLESGSGDWPFVVEHNYSFHSAIIRAAGNSIVSGVFRNLAPLMFKSGEITTAANLDLSRMHADHATIAEAIVQGEAERAEKAMLEHLQHVGLDLITERKRAPE